MRVKTLFVCALSVAVLLPADVITQQDQRNLLSHAIGAHRRFDDLLEKQSVAIEALTQRFRVFEDQTRRIQELTSWQHRQDDIIEKLTLRMSAQDEVIANQAETIRNQSVVMQDLGHEIEQLRSVSENLTQQVRALQCVENERLLASSDSIVSDPVSFHAYTIINQQPGVGEPVLFQNASTNIGGGYNASSSTFTCPETGVYYVYFHLYLRIRGGDCDHCTINIMLDGDVITQARESLTDDQPRYHVEHSGMTGQSALVQCPSGSKIWIQSQDDKCFVSGDDVTKVSTFGGFLVQDSVGFHSIANTTQRVGSGDQVLFQSAPINIGDAYNTSTSTFTCPTQGLYYVYFNLNMLIDSSNGCYVGITLNGDRVAGARENLYDHNANVRVQHGGMSTQSAVIECSSGANISLQSDSRGCTVYGDDTNKFTSFGAFKLPHAVGFHAYATFSQHYEVGERVLFQSALTNIGGGYNTSSSTFTCLMTGIYYVHFDVNLGMFDGINGSCNIVIMLDDHIVATGTENLHDGMSDALVFHYSMTSQSAVVQCTAGSRLWVEGRDDNCWVEAQNKYMLSTFSGFLIQAM